MGVTYNYQLCVVIECLKENCKLRYVGETERKLKERFSDHKQYVKSIIPTQATGEHFNLPGHSLSDMSLTINWTNKKQKWRL